MPAIGLKEVAARAGVSIATVSKVLNGGIETARISQGCRDRVAAAAAALGYVPKYAARSLRMGRAFAIGGLMTHGLDPARPDLYAERIQFWAPVVVGMLNEASARGMQFIALGADGRVPILESGVSYLRQGRIDALVIPKFAGMVAEADALFAANPAPVVLVGDRFDSSLPQVTVDDVAGVDEAVAHLTGLGHRTIMWVGPEGNDGHPARRLAALRRCLATGGAALATCTVDLPARDAHQFGERIAAARDGCLRAWGGRGPDATALLCYNELVAFGACAALESLGLRVPADVSVIGFDDIYAHVAVPPLTVVSLMLQELGARAVQLALEMADDRASWERLRHHHVALPARLVVRNSTGPAPRARG